MLKAEHLMHLQARLGPGVEVSVAPGPKDILTIVVRSGTFLFRYYAERYLLEDAPLPLIDEIARAYLVAERAARPGQHGRDSTKRRASDRSFVGDRRAARIKQRGIPKKGI